VSNFWDQRWCCHHVPEAVSSIGVFSAAAMESVRPAKNTAAAGLLKPIIVASRIGPRINPPLTNSVPTRQWSLFS
jgi:hypothetical protein